MVTVNGAVSLKLKMLFLVNVWVVVPSKPLIWVKLPTAYMVPPQSATCRIVSVMVPVATSVGVPFTGVGDTGPVWASAGAAGRQRAPAAVIAMSAARPPQLPPSVGEFSLQHDESSCAGNGGSPDL